MEIKETLFLVNCEVVISYYMSDTKRQTVTHIVKAETEEIAKDKVRKFYSDKDSSYCIDHWVDFNYCNEMID